MTIKRRKQHSTSAQRAARHRLAELRAEIAALKREFPELLVGPVADYQNRQAEPERTGRRVH